MKQGMIPFILMLTIFTVAFAGTAFAEGLKPQVVLPVPEPLLAQAGPAQIETVADKAPVKKQAKKASKMKIEAVKEDGTEPSTGTEDTWVVKDGTQQAAPAAAAKVAKTKASKKAAAKKRPPKKPAPPPDKK